MQTVREALTAKIQASDAVTADLNVQLSNNQSTFGAWLDEEPVAFKAKFDSYLAVVNQHIGTV